MKLELRQLICKLYVEQHMSMAKICDHLMAERGLYLEPENLKYNLKLSGVCLRSQAEAQAARRGKPESGKLHSQINETAPVRHRPVAALPVRDEGGVPWPTRAQLMRRR